MQQGSEQWHAWRASGIGASEIAAVLGLSPWKTAYQLWLEKTGQAEPFRGNAATRRGQALEEKALDALEDFLGGFVLERGECLKHPTAPLLASLDARLGAAVFDAKCPGDNQYEAMKEGIPPYYEAQLQQQALVASANGIAVEKMGLWVWHPDHGGYLLTTAPSQEWRNRILAAAREFWDRVDAGDWPESAIAEQLAALARAKRVEAEAIETRKAAEAALIEAMKGAGERKLETADGIKAALVCRKVVDKAACEAIPEWRDLRDKEKSIAEARKGIEKQHMKDGAEYIRLTLPE
ncbi:MAG: YqaJ viral recombinase family protein [Mariprofundaceae bacterium]